MPKVVTFSSLQTCLGGPDHITIFCYSLVNQSDYLFIDMEKFIDLVSTQKPQRHVFIGVVWRDTGWLEILNCNRNAVS